MTPLQLYFAGERNGGLVCGALAVAGLIFAVWIWRSGSPFRAMAIPVALFGLLQAGVCVGLVTRTPGQVAKLEQGLVERPAAARAEEMARMEKVMRNFTVIKLVWIVLLTLGVAAVLLARSRPWAVGVGMGLAVECAIMLAFDVFAEQRGAIYLAWSRGM